MLNVNKPMSVTHEANSKPKSTLHECTSSSGTCTRACANNANRVPHSVCSDAPSGGLASGGKNANISSQEARLLTQNTVSSARLPLPENGQKTANLPVSDPKLSQTSKALETGGVPKSHPNSPKIDTGVPVFDTKSAKNSTSQAQKSTLFARIKRIKHIEIYAAVAVIAVMVLIYFSTFGGMGSGNAGQNQMTRMEAEFVRDMEQQLTRTLSQVQGAGRVTAMVTAVGSATLEIAYNIDERTVTQGGANGQSNTTTTVVRTPVIVNGQPVILFEIKPQLKGVVVVATGASNPQIRLQLLRAVQALVADPRVNIEILF